MELVLAGPQADLSLPGPGRPRVQPVSESVLRSISDEVTPNGCVSVVSIPPPRLTSPWPELVLVADEVRDPGNLGTLLRTADAVGAGVLLSGGCADLFSPKVVRASVGALVRVPFARMGQAAAIAAVAAAQRAAVVLDTSGDSLYDGALPLPWPVALVAGNEAHGVSPAWREVGVSRRIPMQPGAESLNVGGAAALALYEAARQCNWFEGAGGA